MIIAATGHRPDKLGGYDPIAEMRLQMKASQYLQAMEPESVIVGMALGWDMAFGWAAVGLGIPLHAAVPFKGQELRWPPSSQEKYNRLLCLCASITVVFPGGYCAYAMQMRNEWMVDRANRIAAMWDGSPGGTCNCVRYAHKRSVPIDNLYE